MERQESLSFIEVCLQLLNNNLKHFKLFSAIVIIPTIFVFVLVMWVLDPVYRATAIVKVLMMQMWYGQFLTLGSYTTKSFRSLTWLDIISSRESIRQIY